MTIEPQSSRADELFARGRAVFPAGVAAAVRLDPALGRPFFAARGEGPYVYDQDGNRFIDLNMSFGDGPPGDIRPPGDPGQGLGPGRSRLHPLRHRRER